MDVTTFDLFGMAHVKRLNCASCKPTYCVWNLQNKFIKTALVVQRITWTN